MYCPECGKENPDQAKFCSSCGADLRGIHQKQNLQDDPEDFGFSTEDQQNTSFRSVTVQQPRKKHNLMKWVILLALLYSCAHKSDGTASSGGTSSSAEYTAASPAPSSTPRSSDTETNTVYFKSFVFAVPAEYTLAQTSEDGTNIAYNKNYGSDDAEVLILWSSSDRTLDTIITDGSGAEEEMQVLFEQLVTSVLGYTCTFTETAVQVKTETAGIFAYAGQADLTGDNDQINYLRYAMVFDVNTDQFCFILDGSKDDPGEDIPDQIAASAEREIPSALTAVYGGAATEGTKPAASDFTVTAVFSDGKELRVLQGYEVSASTLEAGKTSSAAISYLGIKTSAVITCTDTAPTPEPTPTPEPAATAGERNALSSAKTYLSFMPFSCSGLIDQLEYEGYTEEEAVYAADHCGADWNEQAAKSAENYLDFMAFSRDGLIEQLEYEGFTYEQAVYGAEANGY